MIPFIYCFVMLIHLSRVIRCCLETAGKDSNAPRPWSWWFNNWPYSCGIFAGRTINPDGGAQRAAHFRGLMIILPLLEDLWIFMKRLQKMCRPFLAEGAPAGEGAGHEQPEQDERGPADPPGSSGFFIIPQYLEYLWVFLWFFPPPEGPWRGSARAAAEGQGHWRGRRFCCSSLTAHRTKILEFTVQRFLFFSCGADRKASC